MVIPPQYGAGGKKRGRRDSKRRERKEGKLLDNSKNGNSYYGMKRLAEDREAWRPNM